MISGPRQSLQGMSKVVAEVSVSLDGYVAGPEQTLEEPLGRGGEGRWEDDPNANAWWGDEPPFHKPVFVLTHHEREPLVLGETTFTFVTDGVGAAVEQARAAAGDRNVLVAGGAATVDQALAAGLVDELQLHVAPVLLGGGTRLFEGLGPEPPRLELASAVESPHASHLRYRVA